MLQTLKLFLPVLVPSWRFFDGVAPSPRIEYAALNAHDDKAENWQSFRLRPQSLSAPAMLKRLFWNSHWNESLYLVSCAERVVGDNSAHAQNEIAARIMGELGQEAPYMRYRLVFIRREGDTLHKELLFTSRVYSCVEEGES